MNSYGIRRLAANSTILLCVSLSNPAVCEGLRWPFSSDPSLNVGEYPRYKDLYPRGPEPPISACAHYWVTKRTPVYKMPSQSDPPFFYLPRNSRVCLEGKAAGWGIFSHYIAERFIENLMDATPDDNMQYGWVAIDGMEEDKERSGAPCVDLPTGFSRDELWNCTGGFENVSFETIVVLVANRAYRGNTSQTLVDVSLNECLRSCRDDANCAGIAYSNVESVCELKNDGGVDFSTKELHTPAEHSEHDARMTPLYSGMKLVPAP